MEIVAIAPSSDSIAPSLLLPASLSGSQRSCSRLVVLSVVPRRRARR